MITLQHQLQQLDSEAPSGKACWLVARHRNGGPETVGGLPAVSDASGGVRPLHRSAALSSPLSADLTDRSPEQAATALVDRFSRTGYAEASVVEPEVVRGLVRRDCCHRRLRVRTLGVGTSVVLIDEDKRNSWLTTAEGTACREKQQAAAVSCLEEFLGPVGTRSRGQRRPRTPGAVVTPYSFGTSDRTADDR